MNYKELLIKVIEGGNYVLSEMEQRIDRLWIEGKITEADRDELMPLAAEHASDRYQVDVLAKLADLETRIWELEHPTSQYVVWEPGYQTKQHEIVRFDVTGDGELDLCQYNGGRSYTALSIGKIEGWNMLDRELNITHAITRDADGGYVLTPVEPAQESTEAESTSESASESSESASESKPLEDMTKAELLAYAQERGVEVFESWTKAEIIAAIEAA